MVIRASDVLRKQLTYDMLRPNEIQFVIVYNLMPEGAQSYAIDSTGVKFTGAYRLKVTDEFLKHLKAAYIQADAASDVADATIRIHIVDASSGSSVAYLEISSGTSFTESSDISSVFESGKEYYIQIEVSTASATSGATATTHFVCLRCVFGVS